MQYTCTYTCTACNFLVIGQHSITNMYIASAVKNASISSTERNASWGEMMRGDESPLTVHVRGTLIRSLTVCRPDTPIHLPLSFG